MTTQKRRNIARDAIMRAGSFEKAAELSHTLRPYSGEDFYWRWGGVEVVTRPDGRVYEQEYAQGSYISVRRSVREATSIWDANNKGSCGI